MRLGLNLCSRLGLPVSIAVAAVLPAFGQEYPTKQVRMITAGRAGGMVDISTRVIAQGLSPHLGQAVYVENRPGAMSMIGYETASRAAPDGYTLVIGSEGMTSLPYLKKSAASFDPVRDLTPVALAASTYGAIVASPRFPARTIPELVAYAKANPGKVRYSTNGVGGTVHITMELLQMRTGIQLVHIPYATAASAQQINDVLTGEVDLASFGLSTALANRNRFTVLAQTGPQRLSSLADVPTTAELGLPDVRVDIWFGLFVPPRTPQPIVDRLARDMEKTLKDHAIVEKFLAMGFDITYLSQKPFTEYISAEKRKWAQLIPAWHIPMVD